MTTMQILLVYASVTFLVALLLTAFLQGPGVRYLRLMDKPGARSLHSTPTPRSGGIAIAIGMLPAVLHVFFTGDDTMAMLIVGWLLVFGISLVDDMRGLAFWIRLSVHVLAAALVVFSAPSPGQLSMQLLAVFWIVWGTNLFNFMDGMDGLAASMAIIGGAVLSVTLMMAGSINQGMLVVCAAAAATAFFCFNRPPARIFMGDAGSASLGFLFAAIAVERVAADALPGWLPLLVFLPFIGDATFTLVRRAWQRKRVWQAHREHLYQVLVLAGMPVPKVLVIEVSAMLLCAVAAVALLAFGISGWAPFAAVLLLFMAIFWGIMRRCT